MNNVNESSESKPEIRPKILMFFSSGLGVNQTQFEDSRRKL